MISFNANAGQGSISRTHYLPYGPLQTGLACNPARRQGAEHALDVYRIVETRLGEHPFLGGAKMSIAVIHLFRLFWRFRNSANLTHGTLPLLDAFYDRMSERPAVKKTCEIEEKIGYELPS
ncbi:glutathione S-transferase family protein [Rhizobium sp. 2YAF20]|uniref:glutathione S-transferase family protein n=1 Tax=Rhizobium sp. 2YAF20 TaxID=3233027 RepID=UPI003F98527F